MSPYRISLGRRASGCHHHCLGWWRLVTNHHHFPHWWHMATVSMVMMLAVVMGHIGMVTSMLCLLVH